MRVLHNAGIEIAGTNQNGSNALHMAAKRNNELVVRALISYGYKVDMPKNNGITALGITAYRGHVRLLRLL